MVLEQKQPRKLFVQPLLALDESAGVVYRDFDPSPEGMVRTRDAQMPLAAILNAYFKVRWEAIAVRFVI